MNNLPSGSTLLGHPPAFSLSRQRVRIALVIRTIIAQAASKHDVQPRSISFKGAIQTLEAFQPLIAIQGERDSTHRQLLYQQLLSAIATHHVADRPDRFEPRQRKRRQKKYDRMMKPRHEVKRDILKELT